MKPPHHKKSYVSYMVLGVLLSALFVMVKEGGPPAETTCPEKLTTIEARAFYTGKYDSHKVLRIEHEGRTRGLICVGQDKCPDLPIKKTYLQLTVDACTLKGKANKLEVYEMQISKDDSKTILFSTSKP